MWSYTSASAACAARQADAVAAYTTAAPISGWRNRPFGSFVTRPASTAGKRSSSDSARPANLDAAANCSAERPPSSSAVTSNRSRVGAGRVGRSSPNVWVRRSVIGSGAKVDRFSPRTAARELHQGKGVAGGCFQYTNPHRLGDRRRNEIDEARGLGGVEAVQMQAGKVGDRVRIGSKIARSDQQQNGIQFDSPPDEPESLHGVWVE